ncbi:MAG TPA: GntR family transcriptional regulator [Pusillimonas sp.]|uniref:GntR family transcriptional regulator n=1 Tax=Pusillimonas sp. TaxID=3040095 RepID=UPI002B4B2CF1|nr:GntR family transcriptional regulator [Pusillimonas sp.]HLU18633.1 GntR family transcriptional regulator [Pusillimonas sp.]
MQKRHADGLTGHIPAYIQVASALRRRIETGEWLPGEKISTLEELEEEFKRARVTVRQAVGLLEKEGLLTRQQGRGTFVAEHVNDKRWLTLETSWDAMIRSIKGNVPRFINVKEPPPFPRLSPEEGHLADEYGFLRSLQLRDGMPYAVVSVHIKRSVLEKYRDEFMKHTALAVLDQLRGTVVKKAHQTMTIGTADPEVAQLLGVSLSAPTAECRCIVTSDNDEVIYVGEITYRSDCIRLHMDLLDTTEPLEDEALAENGKA